MRGRASRPVCREAWSPHHVGAVVQGRLALDHMGLCSFWNQEPRRGACGPKQDQPVSTFQETASPVLLSLQLTVLTSGTPGSLHSQAPRLSGPLSLGPEEVARVAGMRTSSGAWLEQEQGLWSVLSPSRDQGCGDGDRPTSRRFRPSATSWPGQGRGPPGVTSATSHSRAIPPCMVRLPAQDWKTAVFLWPYFILQF